MSIIIWINYSAKAYVFIPSEIWAVQKKSISTHTFLCQNCYDVFLQKQSALLQCSRQVHCQSAEVECSDTLLQCRSILHYIQSSSRVCCQIFLGAVHILSQPLRGGGMGQFPISNFFLSRGEGGQGNFRFFLKRRLRLFFFYIF